MGHGVPPDYKNYRLAATGAPETSKLMLDFLNTYEYF
jgi:hypothetical protein